MAQTQNLPPVYPPQAYPGPPQFDHSRPPPLQANGQAMQAAVPAQATTPTAYSGTRDNWQFSLIVDQQPVRARMCGFGDKDRRPITPPPCVRLVVTDMRTQKEVPADLVDASFFILQVDLWDELGHAEKNIVKAATGAPAASISTATTTSYPPPPDPRPIYAPPPMAFRDPYNQQLMFHAAPQGYPQPQYPGSMYIPSAPPGYTAQPPMAPIYAQHPYAPHPMYQQPQYQAPMPQQQPHQSGMFTRNLIGSLTVNAFQLRDPKGNEGHWFVLQDLSVRTEGSFRLKMSFFDVGNRSEGGSKLHQGKRPVLATVFSQPFHVFSAKKFPGVIESTELSKCFAGQGIKIPIRKDGGKGSPKNDDED